MSDQTAPASRPSAAYWVLQLLVLVLVLALAPLAWKPISSTAEIIRSFPYQLDREEGFLLNQAIRLGEWKTIYPPIEDYPFLVGNYTPLYPALYAFAIVFIDPGLGAGRGIVLASVILLALIMAAFALSNSREPLAALIAPLVFLTCYELGDWIRFARVDLPALMLGIAGLFAATRERWKVWTPFAVVLFVLAFFTKQTQIVAPAAAVLAWLVQGKPKRAIALGIPTILICAVLVGLLTLFTGGQFWLHTVTYNKNEFHFEQVKLWARHLVRLSSWLMGAWIVAAVAGLVFSRSKGEVEVSEESPTQRPAIALVVYFVLSAISAISIGKDGAASNYLLELQAAGALLIATVVGLLLRRARDFTPGPTIAAAAIVALLAVQAGRLWFVPDIQFAVFGQRLPPPPTLRLHFDNILLSIDNTRGEIISEHPVFLNMIGKDVLYQPYIMKQLAKEGKWDESAFVTDLFNQRFNLIVTTQDLREERNLLGFTPTMRVVILEKYRLREAVPAGVSNFFFYVPRNESTEGIVPIA